MTEGTALASTSAPILGPELPSLVLYGRSAPGRPRAAWFSVADADAATVAAGPLRLQTLPLVDDARREIGGQFARGRMLPSGKPFVPFARRDLYGRLVALAGDNFGFADAGDGAGESKPAPKASNGGAQAKPGTAPRTAAAAAKASGKANAHIDRDGKKSSAPDEPQKPRPGDPTFIGKPNPRSPDEIGLGSVVLAHEGAEEGWWEAEVIGFNGTVFSLRWRDYDPMSFPTILRKASELALVPEGAA